MDPIEQADKTPAAEAAATQQAFAAGQASTEQPGALPPPQPKPGAAAPAEGQPPVGDKKPGETTPTAEGEVDAGGKKPGEKDEQGGEKKKSALDQIREEAATEEAAERQRLLEAEAERLRQQQQQPVAEGKITEIVTQTLADLPKLIEPLKDMAVDDPNAEGGKSTLGQFIQDYPGVTQLSLALMQAVLPKMLEQRLGQSVLPTIKVWQEQQTRATQDRILTALAGDPQGEGDDKGFGHSDIYDLWNDDAKWAKIVKFADGDPLLKRFFDSGQPAKLDKVIRAWRESEGLAMPAAITAAREVRDTTRAREAKLHGHTLRQKPAAPTGDGRKPLTPAEEQRLFDEGVKTVTG
ncbi:MAG: hypothetical protein NTY53_24070 [Kiritimatiellaeota bacterium]|nr:hypothetical protein [Kiritimatiellota bacterium]